MNERLRILKPFILQLTMKDISPMNGLAVTDNEIIVGYTSGSTTTDIKVLDSSPSDYIYFIVISENDRPKRWLANLRIKMIGFSDYLYNLNTL